jgi:8-oxo-dGTP pyrophosphatase MutT (NUDIX family)
MNEWLQPPPGIDVRIARALHPLEQPPAMTLELPPEWRALLPAAESLRPAAVLLGLVDRGQGSRIILTRRNEGLSHHPGQIAFPGGRLDPTDASLLHAALREAQEEIALAPEHVRPLGFIDPLPTLTGFLVQPVVARIDPAHQSIPDPREVAAVFEVPLEFVLDPANARTESLQIAGQRRSVWAFEFGGQRIWGATAAMLVEFAHRLALSDSA